MGRGLSDLQKDILRACLEQETAHWRTIKRKTNLVVEAKEVAMWQVVELAGGGERTPAAEAAASRTVSRLRKRGLIQVGGAGHSNVQWLCLSERGQDEARQLFPKLAAACDKQKAAAEKRPVVVVNKKTYETMKLLYCGE